MDENQPSQPLSGNPEDGAPPQPPPAKNRGSLGLGLALFWGIALLVSLLIAFVGLNFKISGSFAAWLFYGMQCLPLALSIWLAIRGRTRTALGLVLGYVSLAALTLLLISLCAGLSVIR